MFYKFEGGIKMGQITRSITLPIHWVALKGEVAPLGHSVHSLPSVNVPTGHSSEKGWLYVLQFVIEKLELLRYFVILTSLYRIE